MREEVGEKETKRDAMGDTKNGEVRREGGGSETGREKQSEERGEEREVWSSERQDRLHT